MAKKTVQAQAKLETKLENAINEQQASETWLSTVNSDWDELEAMLIVSLTDSISQNTPSKIFDPRLSTIVYERTGRVVGQLAKGEAFAASKDDVGKSMFMNLMLGYYEDKANEQYRMLPKLRMFDLYSLVHGTAPGIVPWRVNKGGYIGPELNLIPIRDWFPQPGRSVRSAERGTIRNVVSMNWLKQQSSDVWKNIDELEASIERNPSDDSTKLSTDSRSSSYEQRTFFPGPVSSTKYPGIEIFTEYKNDAWLTWTPQRTDQRTGRPFILREVGDSEEPPYCDGLLPTVSKDAFSLLNLPIGIGEFARGKSLQYTIDSLINLYMTGLALSINPPVHVNIDNVVPSSLKWEDGAFWYMDNPNRDVQVMKLDSQGLNTFHSTYNFLVSALMNQSGTTQVTGNQEVESTLGKTPAAIDKLDASQSARDSLDSEAMEAFVMDVYERWIKLTVTKQEVPVERRIFAEEIKDIAANYPDVIEMFESGKRAKVKISRKNLDDDYDFVIEKGSMYKRGPKDEHASATSIIKGTIDNPELVAEIRKRGKDIDFVSLYKWWLVSGGKKDWDKVLIDAPIEQSVASIDGAPGAPAVLGGAPQPELPGTVDLGPQGPSQGPSSAPEGEGMPAFMDPDIAAAASQILNGTQGVPTT